MNELSNACARLLVCQPAETRRLFRGSVNELRRIEYKHTFNSIQFDSELRTGTRASAQLQYRLCCNAGDAYAYGARVVARVRFEFVSMNISR